MFVDKQIDLVSFCERAQQSDVLAVDTEFLREKTYHPKLCLLQMSISEDDIVAVDPLAIKDFSPVVELFKNPSITKVFHSCSQDIEVIDSTLNCVPAPIFDTQVAAAFLGHRMQLGYGGLVEVYTGVHLAKAESHTDWSRRPLDPAQLVYAEDDVRYLPGIYRQMVKDLIEVDRLSWVIPEIQDSIRLLPYRLDPRDSYLHLKRVSTLSRPQLAISRELCEWRDVSARRMNIPRKWIISDELIVDICKRAPKDKETLCRIRGCEALSDTKVTSILKAVRRAQGLQPEYLPKKIKVKSPSQTQESVVDVMYSLLRIVASEADIAPQLVATRDDLFKFLLDDDSTSLMHGWRYDLVGKKLESLLKGETALTVKDGEVVLL